MYISQLTLQIAQLFCEGKIHDGDYFPYTDAGITLLSQFQIHGKSYLIQMLLFAACGMQVVMIPRFSRRLIGDADWVRNAEQLNV